MKTRKHLIALVIAVSVLPAFAGSAANLESADVAASVGSTVTLDMIVNNAPNDVHVLGFDIHFPDGILSFQSHDVTGTLVSGFDYFEINEIAPGHMRVGGMDTGTDKIGQNESGPLVAITFLVTGLGSGQIEFVNLEDDIAGWSTKSGSVSNTDAYETDDLFTRAGTVDTVQVRNFHDFGDEDWGMIYGRNGGEYTLQITNPGVRCDPVIEIYGPDGATLLVSQNDNGAGEGELLNWTCPEDAIYFVKTKNNDPNVFGTDTTYNLKCEYPDKSDPYGPDDNTYDKATRIRVDEKAQRHSLTSPEDEDWIRFYALANETYYIEGLNLDPTCDLVIDLYETEIIKMSREEGDRHVPGLVFLGTRDSSAAGRNEMMEFLCLRNGYYFVRLSNKFSHIGVAAFDIWVRSGSTTTIPGKISGVVLYRGAPLEGAVIKVASPGPSRCRACAEETNQAGVFLLQNLPGVCDFTLTAFKPGFIARAFTVNGIRIPASQYGLTVDRNNQLFAIDVEMSECAGDINGDGEITPGDALAGFERYMGICPTTLSRIECVDVCCDVNKDGVCSPADALCIFNNYLQKPNCLD